MHAHSNMVQVEWHKTNNGVTTQLCPEHRLVVNIKHKQNNVKFNALPFALCNIYFVPNIVVCVII